MSNSSNWYKSFKYWKKTRLSKFRGKSIEETFKEIHEKNFWQSDDSVSGTGSDQSQTATISHELPILFKEYDVKSMLDIPCGDFNWMNRVDLTGISYIGGDIVPDLILRSQEKYSADSVKFELLNLVADTLPKVDVVFTRDCWVHFSYADTKKALSNIIDSGSKYLLATSFIDRERNYNIATGEWRPINLTLAPYNFPEPLMVINEKCTQDNGSFPDKSLLLWKVEDLNLAAFD